MATGHSAYGFLARHGAAINRLVADMTAEPDTDRPQFLAYEAANFMYGFLLVAGPSQVTPTDRRLRDDLQKAILEVLCRNGLDDAALRA